MKVIEHPSKAEGTITDILNATEKLYLGLKQKKIQLREEGKWQKKQKPAKQKTATTTYLY